MVGSPIAALPRDFPDGDHSSATVAHYSVALEATTTGQLLHVVPPVYHTRINDVLLTALAQAVGQWSGQPQVLVDLEGHGRDVAFSELDLSRTVGWFTTIHPVRLDLTGRLEPGEALPYVKETYTTYPQQWSRLRDVTLSDRRNLRSRVGRGGD